jgi:hypothetical protein
MNERFNRRSGKAKAEQEASKRCDRSTPLKGAGF